MAPAARRGNGGAGPAIAALCARAKGSPQLARAVHIEARVAAVALIIANDPLPVGAICAKRHRPHKGRERELAGALAHIKAIAALRGEPALLIEDCHPVVAPGGGDREAARALQFDLLAQAR